MNFCECEKAVQSEYPSPGVVHSEEIVLRLFYSPEHVDDHGKIQPQAIPKDDLSGRSFSSDKMRYLSVFRKIYVDDNSLISLAEHQMERSSERKKCYLFSACVSSLREMLDDEHDRAVCVIDKALSNNYSHAGVVPTKYRSRSKVLGIRKKIADMMTAERVLEL